MFTVDKDTRQLTLNFQPGITSVYASCREYVAARIHQQKVSQKHIAMDMDYSPSDLSRKLAQNENDSRRFTLDDLETYIRVTGDREPIIYLVEKYLANTKDDEIAHLKARLKELGA